MTISVSQKIEQLAKTGKRSIELIPTFKDGYAEGWYMAVRESFRSKLDIKYTSRVEEKKKIKQWTQGPRIAFDNGNIFYDTPHGYQVWNEAIKHIKLACVVINGKPNDVKKTKSPDGKEKTDKLVDGFVEVEFFVPNDDNTKLVLSDKKKMSQNEFVEFLITGKLR